MRILVDLDSTLVDILTPVLKILNDKYHKSVSLSHLTHWDYIVKEFPKKEFYSLLQQDNFYFNEVLPIDGSIEFMRKLAENHEVIIVTAGQKTVGKVEYINKYYGEFINDLIFEQNKYEIRGKVLVDDRFSTIQDWVNYTNELGIIFRNNDTYGYNDILWQNPLYKRCNTYDEILDEISKY